MKEPPERTGFGTQMTAHSVVRRLGGSLSYDWAMRFDDAPVCPECCPAAVGALCVRFRHPPPEPFTARPCQPSAARNLRQ